MTTATLCAPIDRSDTDAAAFDPDAVCDLVHEGDCEGCLIPRRLGNDQLIYLCAWHAADVDFVVSGIIPAMQKLAATEPVRKAG